jgi:hypothetical protein
MLARLRTDAPDLKTNKGAHYADVLERLAKDRIDNTPRGPESDLTSRPPDEGALKPSKIGSGPRIDKRELTIAEERRYRDKQHLRFVASQPCIVCGRQPSHAHHLTFAQPRGLSIKVSDEFTVPLCAVHHDELHRSGFEIKWWTDLMLEPEPLAAELWGKSRGTAAQDATPRQSAHIPPQSTQLERQAS